MKCKECSNELKGRQKIFCSSTCKSKHFNNLYGSKPERLLKHKEWRDKNKDRISENKARYYKKHRERLLEIRRKYHQEHPETDKAYKQSPKGQLMIYKRGANVRNLEFKLDLQYILDNWNKNCYYCGDKIDGIGIDRIDNTQGYINGNVVNCCTMCNKMKLNYTKDDFINQCRKVSHNLF